MTPVEYAIFSFGGPVELAKSIGVTHSAICQWKLTGRIPSKRATQILAIARVRGIDLNANDLLEGRVVKSK